MLRTLGAFFLWKHTEGSPKYKQNGTSLLFLVSKVQKKKIILKKSKKRLAFRGFCGIIYNVEIWAFSRKSKKLTEDQTK